MDYAIRPAQIMDLEAMIALLPRLAEFELPPKRVAAQLWEGDAALLRRWAGGEAPECFVEVAVDPGGALLGVALVSLREELLSHEPSAHLEVIVLDPRADGHGIGRALIASVEAAARQKGARSMSLHVFANNHRARHVYAQIGYEGELLRYIKKAL